jgi:hypothetical protein
MRKLLLSLLAISLFLGVVASAAENPTGKWTAQVPGRDGQTRETTFTFKLEGDKVTGSMSGMQGAEIPISDGKMTGDTLTFVISMERGGNTMKFNYSGVLSGDEMKMKREGGQGQAREFVAKRAK